MNLVSTSSLRGELTAVRDYTGTNNNVDHAQWGAAGSTLLRMAPDSYPDETGQLIRTEPNPRDVSNRLAHQAASLPDERGLSGFVWQWGQFLDHDMSLTVSGSPAETAPIVVADVGDILYPAIPFTRSMIVPGTGTTNTPRQHPNQISSYIDASNIYGSNADTAVRLRTMQDGKLMTSPGDLMPNDNQGNFMSGDVRANEQLGLMSMHTLFMREHNRLATQIANHANDLPQDPVARDESIYQRARKLVGAEMQIITYHEFLPALLGEHTLTMDAIQYDPTIDATIANEFAHGLYRFGHSMLPAQLTLVDDTGATTEVVDLRDAFFKPDMMTDSPERVGLILKGLAGQPAQRVDTQVVEDVRSFLMLEGVSGGLDLPSLNVQRGRDHGLPGYNDAREDYGLPRVSDWSQITDDTDLQLELAALYSGVDQVDLFVGALAEEHLPGASVGPLIHAALIDQFTRLRDGDRFFYAFDPDVPDLLEEANLNLSSWTLSDVIRANTQISHLQDNVFFVPEPLSTLTSLWLLSAIMLVRGGRKRAFAA